MLDLSKLSMYDYYYRFPKHKYESRISLCYMVTDGLIFKVQTDDIHEDMKSNLERFDTSNFDKNNPYTVFT